MEPELLQVPLRQGVGATSIEEVADRGRGRDEQGDEDGAEAKRQRPPGTPTVPVQGPGCARAAEGQGWGL